VVNTITPGDKVLCLSAGNFGEHFGDLAKIFGADVEMQIFPDSKIIDPDEVAKKLKGMKDVKAVLVTHNESFTGVLHPLKEIAEAVHAHSDALIHVDAVSATGGVDTQLEAWGLDTVCTATQKALMASPGMAVVAVSERAFQTGLLNKNPRYIHDWRLFRESLKQSMTPSTTSMSVLFGLSKAMEMIQAEGIENVYARHLRVAAFTRQRILDLGMGLSLFPEPRGYSPTLTAVKLPEGVNGDEVRARAKVQGVELGGAWYRLQGKILRIGHMGMTTEADIDHAIEVLGDVMAGLVRQ
jgi:aspartate aminotransferase-like enzyme